MGRVLVAYATKTGTTREVAEEIGKVLSARGHSVEVADIAANPSAEGYSAVVVGAPINGMKWLQAAEAFVAANAPALRVAKTSYFFVSYLLFEGRPAFGKIIGKSLDAASALASPLMKGAFGGRLPSELPAFARLLFGVKRGRPLDIRDWLAIRDWASELAGKIA